MQLERESKVPLHRQLKDALRRRIQAGEWRSGEKIPSEPELAQTLGIARGTVRSAISELVHDGLLERRQGDGTYVTRRSIEHTLMGFYSFAREAARRGVDLTSQVVEWDVVPADLGLAESLGLKPGDGVLHVTRVRSLDGERVLLETCHLPAERTARLRKEDFAQGAIYDALEKYCEIVVSHAEETFEAVALGALEAALLGVARGMPALRVQRTAYALDDRPVESRVTVIRGDRCRYHIRLGK